MKTWAATARASHATTTGARGSGPTELAAEVKRVSQPGALPLSCPLVHSRITPPTAEPVARVTTNGGSFHTLAMRPFAAPTRPPASTTTAIISGDEKCSPVSRAAMTLPAPITAGTERSIPPMSTTNVWPSAAIPRKEAITSMARTDDAAARPGTTIAPITKTATTVSSWTGPLLSRAATRGLTRLDTSGITAPPPPGGLPAGRRGRSWPPARRAAPRRTRPGSTVTTRAPRTAGSG